MNTCLKDDLIQAGVDYDSALRRFMGKEDLYQKFLIKFLKDENFIKLRGFIKEKNTEEAFKCAHTIKGLAGNLGFNNLLESDSILVEILREGSMDGVPEKFAELEERYEQLCEIIKKYQ